MQIVHVLKHIRHSNGNVNVAIDLACQQVADGFRVKVISHGGYYDDLLRKAGVEVYTVRSGRQPARSISYLGALLAQFLKDRPTYVHAHMMESATLAALACALFRLPLITTVHNSFDRHSFLMRLGRRVVAVSESERKLLISRGYSEARTAKVLNGVSGAARGEIDVDESDPISGRTVMMLTGLHSRKCVNVAIEAFASALSACPGWNLIIVGDGPDREKLESLTAKLGLQDSVHFLGPRMKPQRLLESAEIFMTATSADPCPLSVAEARIAGCAIVATDAGGIPELLEDGAAGHLSPVGNVGALSASLGKLMSDTQYLQDWRRRSREGADNLTVGRMAKEYELVYQAAQVDGRTSTFLEAALCAFRGRRNRTE